MVASSPSALKRWIGAELRRLRLAHGRTRAQVAERLGKTAAWPGHIETGLYSPGLGDVEVLLGWYGVPDRLEFFKKLLARVKKNKDWWIGFDLGADAVPEWFSVYLGLESILDSLSGYDAITVPGLLQTPDYARRVIHAVHPQLTDAELDRRVELRIARQEILAHRTEDQPLNLWRVVDEAALRKKVGGDEVWRRQLEQLVKMSEKPNVTLQVITNDQGAHPGVEGMFSVMDFPAEFVNDPGIIYTESRVRGTFYEELEDIKTYRATLDLLKVQALKPDESVSWIDRLARETA